MKVEIHLSFYESRKPVVASTPVAANKSYATVVKVSTISIATQTDLTWPNELSLLVVKHNPLAVYLQETFLKDTDTITVRGFNLYHKFHETENRVGGCVWVGGGGGGRGEGCYILVNENIPQSIVTLNTNLQAEDVKVKAHKTITLCSVYLPPRNHFNFNPK